MSDDAEWAKKLRVEMSTVLENELSEGPVLLKHVNVVRERK